LPPVLRRMITWISCASEKSTLVVTAHCKAQPQSAPSEISTEGSACGVGLPVQPC
jgi:hypothetical protein